MNTIIFKFNSIREGTSLVNLTKKSVILAFIFLLSSAKVSSVNKDQKSSLITVKNSSTVSVEKVFDLIKQQTSTTFFYKSDWFKNSNTIALEKGVYKVEDLLSKVSKVNGVDYKLTETGSIILRKPTFQGVVSGSVLDDQGMPLVGVSVLLNTTEKATETNDDGTYQIEAKKGDILTFAYIGYKIQSVTVLDQTEINIIMEEDVTALEEVIVTGYQKVSVNETTGAANTISSKYTERRGISNLLESLEGQVNGLTVFNDPNNEGEKLFNIRGVATIKGNSQPLIVVDGFPLEGKISNINPYEVKSVTVLRDAAAASIYGSRAANGVIVIVTKRGENNQKPKISYRSITTIGSKPDVSYRLNRLSSSDLVDLQLTSARNLRSTPHTYEWHTKNSNPLSSSYFEATTLVYDAVAKLGEGKITNQQAEGLFSRLRKIDNTQQIQDYFYRPFFEQQHNLSVNGGGEMSSYRATLNYTTKQFQKAGQDSDKIMFDIANNLKFNDKIRLDVSGNVVFRNSTDIPLDMNNIHAINSYENLIDSKGNPLPVRLRRVNVSTNDSGIFGGKDPFEIKRLISKGLLDETYYPLKELQNYSNNEENVYLRLQSRLSADVFDWLTSSVSFQYETNSTTAKKIALKNSFETTQIINNTTPLSYTGNENELNIPKGDRIIDTRGNSRSYTLRGQLDFNKEFGVHGLSAILGSEIREVFNASTIVDKFGYDQSSLLVKNIDRKKISQDLNNVYHPRKYVAGGVLLNDRDPFLEGTTRYFSLYANMAYRYANKYVLSGSARIDQSNLFGTDPKYRNKPFWSVGAKWRVDQENFFKSDFINRLNLRFSYGVNGYIPNKYGPVDIAKAEVIFRSDNANSLFIETPAVKNIRPERTTTTNYGFDIDFADRVSLSLDYYNKNTTDVLADGENDPTLGFATLIYNDASIKNTGFELSLNSTNIRSEDFQWNTILNFRTNKNEVLDVYTQNKNSFANLGIRSVKGAPVNSFYVFNWKGLSDKGYPVVTNGDGDEVVIDETFQPQSLTVDDLVAAGTSVPKYSGSLINNLTYKNFGLSFMFVGSGGHSFLRDTYNGEGILKSPSIIHADATNVWQKAGDENKVETPGVSQVSAYASSISKFSTKNIFDADYIRLRELIFTYTLQGDFINNYLDNVVFNLRGNNLFYFTKNDLGIDPESHGVGFRYFPVKPSYSLGVNVNF